jgi:hypothetical protein
MKSLALLVLVSGTQITTDQYGHQYLQLPDDCVHKTCIIVAPPERPYDKAIREYQERQREFQCSQHPEKCGGTKK